MELLRFVLGDIGIFLGFVIIVVLVGAVVDETLKTIFRYMLERKHGYRPKEEDTTPVVKIINRSKHKLPAYETIGSAGMDLRANIKERIKLHSLERIIVPTGLFIELPLGYEAQIRPRSGAAYKKGLVVANSPGTIDSDYRGEVGIIVVNLDLNPIYIDPSDRIAQMVIAKCEQAKWKEVAELGTTDRGAGGYGSTEK